MVPPEFSAPESGVVGLSGDVRTWYSRLRRLAVPLAIISTLLAIVYCVLKHPSWTAYPAVLGPLLIYFIIGLFEYRPDDTPDGYFLFDRKMPTKYFVWTFVATNLGLFSSVAYSALLAYAFGVAAMVWVTLAWFLGMFWFSRKIHRLLPFFRRGNTLHQFISESYGETDIERLRLRILTSIVTGTLFWASIAIEVKFGAMVLTPLLGFSSAASLAVVVALVGVCYSFLAGYRGAVHTDLMQGWVMALGSVGILVGCGLIVRANWQGIPAGFFQPGFLLFGPDKLSLLSMLALMLPYQFCVMDMWQRCIAVSQSSLDGRSTPSDEQVVKSLKSLVFRRAILPFLWLFIVWYAMGITALGAKITDDPGNIVPSFLASLQGQGQIATVARMLAIIVFISALISTLDTFTVALTQSFMYDIFANARSKYRSIVAGTATDEVKRQFVYAARFFVAVFGLSATIIAFCEVNLLNFWVGMYSLMLAFFPPVYIQLLPEQSFLRRRVRFRGAFWGVLCGFIVALILGVVGTFIMNNSTVVSLAPFGAMLVSAAVSIAMPPRKSDV